MIQRVQSLLLFVASILMFLSAFYFNVWEATKDGCTYTFGSMNAYTNCDSEITNTKFVGYIYMLEVLFVVISLVSIFSYKKRKRQLLLGGINSILGSACLMCLVFMPREWIKEFGGDYELGFYFPLVAIFMNILANRFIRKDEKMVKSLDSLR